MKIYVQKQIQTLYTPNTKKQSIKFNIIKQNENKINHIHGKTVDDKGSVLKINLKKYKISDFKQHIKNNDSYKLNSNEVYKIYDESKIKDKPSVHKKKKSLTKKPLDKKKKSLTKKPVDKKKKSLTKKPVDKKAIIKKKSYIKK
jgi:hypothetical protein